MKSTLRENYRYVLAKYAGKQNCAEEIKAIAQKYLLSSLGTLGIFQSGARVISAEKENVIIRCVRGEEERICAALALCNHIDGEKIRLKVLRVSGTLRALCEKQGIKKPKRRKR
ncbi:hypothetical protein COU37_02090 [Candidatus Micrarchaeota archaeon CG10_big_fil_rev_8_21_14_0_10_45_29]|nr:MAG: hypothetical protein COU37_02090 [Candidatus Micrarchaeota archaeon CG10_big_fil_rev_8_21_14_0_10_45_29]